ncbi:MAG: hypothetical protein ACE5GB_01260 [Acidimicrobiales bacterium]
MPLPTSTAIRRLVLTLMVLVLVSEWNIRRHLPQLDQWPRSGRDEA